MTADLASPHADAFSHAEAVLQTSLAPDGRTHRGALLSPCGSYRWMLWRTWGLAPPAVFVMLNPSTASGLEDDPTIRRCVGFAKGWGAGGIEVVNLFAWRATKPAALRTARKAGHDVAGPLNPFALKLAVRDAGTLVCAWGAHPLPELTVASFLAIPGMFGKPTWCLGRSTKTRAPRHPLMLPTETALERYT